jgi:hypothetical protein
MLKHGPMVLDGALDTEHFFMCVSDAGDLARSIGVDLTPWLDDLHDHMPAWYPHERMHIKPSMAKEVTLRGAWQIEDRFWGAAFIQDGYVSSRWNTLIQSPHAQVFCSTLLLCCHGLGELSSTSAGAWLLMCKRLMAILSETSSGQGAVAVVGHVRYVNALGGTTISWDASGGVNEATVQVFTNLMRITERLEYLPLTPQQRVFNTELFELFRTYNVYLGVELKSTKQCSMFLSSLQIQTNWAFRERPRQSNMRVRILCLANNVTSHNGHWLEGLCWMMTVALSSLDSKGPKSTSPLVAIRF